MPPRGTATQSRSERRFVFVYSLLLCLTFAHAIYYGYATYYAEITANHPGISQQQFYAQHNTVALSLDHPFFTGHDHAPGQYRIGIELPAKLLARALHVTRLYQLFAAIDLFTGVAACMLLYNALRGSEFFDRLDPSARKLTIALLLASFAYPFFWATSWIRPETIPSALYLAFALSLLQRLRRHPAWLGVLLAATLWQATIRSDVAAIFGLAVVLSGFRRTGFTRTGTHSSDHSLLGSRSLALVTGLSILAVAVLTQAMLQFVLYPHATYAPDGKPFTLLYNLHPRVLTVFVIALLPYALTLGLAARRWSLFDRASPDRAGLDPSDLLAISASLFYLPVWFAVGIVAEVRIFVPFLLLLTPTAAKLFTLMLTDVHATPTLLLSSSQRCPPSAM